MKPMHLLTRMYEWGDCMMLSLAILSVPFWIYVALYAAPETQIVAQQLQQDALWRESRAFCEKYGMPAGTPRFAECVKDLTEIRARESQRVAAETDVIF